MIRFKTRNKLLYDREEVWFNDDASPEISAQNTIFYQSSVLPDRPAKRITSFQTSLIDLGEPEDSIFQKINSTFRNHIRRAERVGLEFHVIKSTDKNEIIEFLRTQKEWSKLKNRSSLSPERFLAIFEGDRGVLTCVKQEERAIAFHLYVTDTVRARMLTSHHVIEIDDAKLIGYANKYLHWKGILHFKGDGKQIYDFGGVDMANTPGIARFKKSFGGREEVTHNFSIERGLYRAFSFIRNSLKR